MKRSIDPYFAEMLERYAKAIRDGEVRSLTVEISPSYDIDPNDRKVVTRRVTVALDFEQQEAQVPTDSEGR